MAHAFLKFVARNLCHNITTSLNQLTMLIKETSERLLCDCHLLDTLKCAHAKLITMTTFIAGGSEGQE